MAQPAIRGQSRVCYTGSTAIAGETAPPRPGEPTSYRRVVSGRDRLTLVGLAGLSIVAGSCLVTRLLVADVGDPVSATPWLTRAVALMVVAVEVLRLLQVANLLLFAAVAADPVPSSPPTGLRVAMLTTIVPDREPVDVVARTLAAMRAVRHDGVLDVWILDEGDDPAVRRVARELGVHHFTRRGRPDLNTPAGTYRARTKAGNHNAWRSEHESAYDVVAQMDPDHVPLPCFLERTLGYFQDPDVAFVVAPQVYGNAGDGFVQHAAAAQSFVFTGVIQRGGNGLGAPLLIGTNHVYRVSAWSQIGGYQDSLIEDHLTGMTVSATVNPVTARGWRGVYTPDVIAIGEGPASWTDFFKQQRRWAYGVAEIVLHRAPRLLGRLAGRQRLAYVLLQSFYPSCAAAWVCGNTATTAYLLLGVAPPALEWWWFAVWALAFGSSLGLLGWLRRFNIAGHERAERGARGVLASLLAGPVYVAATVSACLRRPLAYAVTPKGEMTSLDSPATFRTHLGWAAVVGSALVVASGEGHLEPLRTGWALVTLAVTLVLPLGLVRTHVHARAHARQPILVGTRRRPGRPA